MNRLKKLDTRFRVFLTDNQNAKFNSFMQNNGLEFLAFSFLALSLLLGISILVFPSFSTLGSIILLESIVAIVFLRTHTSESSILTIIFHPLITIPYLLILLYFRIRYGKPENIEDPIDFFTKI